MSTKNTPWNLPDKTVDRADEADREIRMSDFALMAVLPFRTTVVSGYPINEFAMAALVMLCLFRPARGGARLPGVVTLLGVSLLALLVLSGLANNIDWVRRVGHVGITAGVIWAFGTGRASLRSGAIGMAAGLIAVIGMAIVGIGGDFYPGRLTGFLGDPNAGAYFIAALGVIAVFFADDRLKVRVAIAIPILTGLWLCYSRTGLLAAGLGLVWIVYGRRLGQVAGTALAIVFVWLVQNVPEDLISFGPFSNRSGSDNLRKRIIAQEDVELATSPWYGNGPGTAKVTIRDLEFFFHNSYLATRQEGGWLALLLVLGLLAYSFGILTTRSHAGDLRAAAVQSAVIGTAVMAVTLGEVLLDTPAGIVVAFALGHALTPATTTATESPPDG
ncbi:hypothetical protein EUA06_05190 [Nocardioides glacieisoli]|uniref:O-antigen ligase domain-containing protein n=1 Tax=Nocardioides glacieisoli TaxID=1168730 RepID=A0A4V1RKI0_9ACTN|nr:hypothetical protein [Nocardioides glacieisoli]RYB92352.1 hypothetical protein EUA06_05190 [Nocardioides glacieisoli]